MAPFRELLLQHHLSETTRAARRNLLVLSVVAYLLVKGQLVPDRIDFLGISIGKLQQTTLMQALFALLIYYFAKFYLYMFTDGEVHLYKAFLSLFENQKFASWKEYQTAVKAKQMEAYAHVGGWGMILLFARQALDVLLPLAVAGYAVWLVSRAL